jgi:hypothetical protein
MGARTKPSTGGPPTTSGGEPESLESLLEPERTGVHKTGDKKPPWVLIIVILAVLAAGAAAAVVFLMS